MSLNYVTLTLDLVDGQGNPVTEGWASLAPSATLTDTADGLNVTQAPVLARFRSGIATQVRLLATDNGALAPAGWGWSITFTGVPGAPAGFSFFLPFASGASQNLSSQTPVASVTTMAAYLPLDYPAGAAAGYVWTSDANGNGSWQPPSGGGGGGLLADRGAIAASTAYSPGDTVAYQGQRVLITAATTSSTWPNWFTPPTLTAGTYIPITSQAVYYAADWGVIADGVTDNAPALNRALQFMSKGLNSGGFLVLPGGYEPNGAITGVSSTVIIPPGCYIAGGGPEVSAIRLNASANCDVIQFQTDNSASQAALINAATGAGPAAGSIRNAFYSGLMHLTVHGNKAVQGKSQYNFGVNMTVNPANTQAGTDPDFDPTNFLLNVEIRNCTGDGFVHVGRGQLRVTNCIFRYNDGWGAVPSFDSLYTGCNFGENGLGGIYASHGSCNGAANKAFNNGQAAQWASGSNYAAGTVVMSSGVLYRAINSLTGDTTAPASDPANWAALASTAPQGWGWGFYFDSNASECAWTACDGQENSAGDYYLKSCNGIALQGVSNRPNFNQATGSQNGSNPNGYACLVLDGAAGSIADIAYSTLGSVAYVIKAINGATRNDVRMTGDTSYQAVLPAGSITLPGSGNSVSVNGTSLTLPPGSANGLATLDSGGHVAASQLPVVSGQYLCAPKVYAPAARTAVSVSTATMAAFSTGVICTNSFTAPASGSVVVTLHCIISVASSGNNIGFALGALGTITPVIGNVITPGMAGSAIPEMETVIFVVTGLTPGNSYQFDLLGATTSGSATIEAQGQNSTALTSAGGPVVMTVQAI